MLQLLVGLQSPRLGRMASSLLASLLRLEARNGKAEKMRSQEFKPNGCMFTVTQQCTTTRGKSPDLISRGGCLSYPHRESCKAEVEVAYQGSTSQAPFWRRGWRGNASQRIMGMRQPHVRRLGWFLSRGSGGQQIKANSPCRECQLLDISLFFSLVLTLF